MAVPASNPSLGRHRHCLSTKCGTALAALRRWPWTRYPRSRTHRGATLYPLGMPRRPRQARHGGPVWPASRRNRAAAGTGGPGYGARCHPTGAPDRRRGASQPGCTRSDPAQPAFGTGGHTVCPSAAAAWSLPASGIVAVTRGSFGHRERSARTFQPRARGCGGL